MCVFAHFPSNLPCQLEDGTTVHLVCTGGKGDWPFLRKVPLPALYFQFIVLLERARISQPSGARPTPLPVDLPLNESVTYVGVRTRDCEFTRVCMLKFLALSRTGIVLIEMLHGDWIARDQLLLRRRGMCLHVFLA